METKDLALKRNNAWKGLSEDQKKTIFDFSNDYRGFLDAGKTERTSTVELVKYAKEQGFVDIEEVIKKGTKLTPGMKIYGNNKGKSVIYFIIGQEPIASGMNIVGGHIDVPRIDVKANPLYEDTDMAMLKTHYYGGIKKYQWAAMPLSLHGTIFKRNGEKVDICIGEDENDPIFHITDILPHLAKDQAQKKIGDAIAGEDLNLLVGSMPLEGEEKEAVKMNVLRLLFDQYGVKEEDFLTAELEIVPAGKARDAGLDRSMISAYGHDDRVCSFAGAKAVLDIEKTPTKTAVGMFMDKEEVGSQGNTGSESHYFANIVAELINLQEEHYTDLYVRRAFMNSKVLSADVGAAYDPKFAGAYDKLNSGLLGYGLQVVKYTGARGKSGCNDANAEFLHEVAKVFDDAEVVWQFGELGKVDQGGGGTIAYILANYGAEVVDCGVPVLSMHAPYEIISKVDLYMAYKGYKAFLAR